MLKLQFFGYLMRRADAFGKGPKMPGKIEDKRRGWPRTRWLDSITNPVDMNLSKVRKKEKDRETQRAAIYGVAKSWT